MFLKRRSHIERKMCAIGLRLHLARLDGACREQGMMDDDAFEVNCMEKI